jgi:hypothetical protein
MTSSTTAAIGEQIDLSKAPEVKPPNRKTAPSGSEGQASRAASSPAVGPIRLNTMPSPASGPGGPWLTSRRH